MHLSFINNIFFLLKVLNHQYVVSTWVIFRSSLQQNTCHTPADVERKGIKLFDGKLEELGWSFAMPLGLLQYIGINAMRFKSSTSFLDNMNK